MPPFRIAYVAAFVVWLAGRNLFEIGLNRIYWNRRWNGPGSALPLLNTANIIWRLAPACYLLLTYAWTRPTRPALIAFYLGLLAFVLIDQFISRLWNDARMRRFGSPVTRRSLWKAIVYRRWRPTDIFLLFPVAALLPMPAGPLLMNGAIIYLFVDSRRRSKRAPAGMNEMEETPLLSEINFICEQFGRKLRQVFIRSQRESNPAARVPIVLFENPYGGSTPRLVIPAENLHELNPDTYTAVLARSFAMQPFIRLKSKRVINLLSPLILFLVMLVVAGIIITLAVIGAQKNKGVPPGWIFSLLPIFFIALFTMIIYFSATRGRAHTAAMNVWSEAAPRDTVRTIGDYVSALAEHHAFVTRITDPELVMHQLMLELGLIKFLGANLAAAREQAHQHLTTWMAHRGPA